MRWLLFIVVFLSLQACKPSRKEIVAIQPFGKLNGSLLDTIKNTLEKEHNLEVLLLSSIELPSSAFINVKSPRYRADSLLRFLKRNKASGVDYIIGVTTKDISTTKRDMDGNVKLPKYKYNDWGVCGLGYRPGPSCVVSTYRLKSRGHTNLIQRMKKVCTHEVGHNRGLKHCSRDQSCVMKDAAESVSTIDGVGLSLCNYCKNDLD